MPNPAGYSQHTSGFWRKDSDSSGPYAFDGTNIVPLSPVYPIGGVALTSSSGNVANATATATLAAAAGQTTYCSGFEITSAGATAAAIVLATLSGIAGGTATYVQAVVAGATSANPTLTVTFNPPIPASAANTAIVLSLPALGAGNTNAAVTLHGYRV